MEENAKILHVFIVGHLISMNPVQQLDTISTKLRQLILALFLISETPYVAGKGKVR